jgi:hypothetical protein
MFKVFVTVPLLIDTTWQVDSSPAVDVVHAEAVVAVTKVLS